MDYIKELGSLAIATRLQKLSEAFWKDREKIYRELGIGFKPKWFPVVYLLTQQSPLSIKDIALHIGFAHPSVIQIVTELQEAGMTRSVMDKVDNRKRLVWLTPRAKKLFNKYDEVWKAIGAVNNELLNTPTNLLKAIEEVEQQFAEESFYERFQKLYIAK